MSRKAHSRPGRVAPGSPHTTRWQSAARPMRTRGDACAPCFRMPTLRRHCAVWQAPLPQLRHGILRYMHHQSQVQPPHAHHRLTAVHAPIGASFVVHPPMSLCLCARCICPPADVLAFCRMILWALARHIHTRAAFFRQNISTRRQSSACAIVVLLAWRCTPLEWTSSATCRATTPTRRGLGLFLEAEWWFCL